DAPVSQVYYRYDEGDDYDEEVAGGALRGLVLARRNVTIAGGKLRRIGCPQGTFVASGDGQWFELSGDEVALLAGGQGTAARPPRPGPPPLLGRLRMEPARATCASAWCRRRPTSTPRTRRRRCRGSRSTRACCASSRARSPSSWQQRAPTSRRASAKCPAPPGCSRRGTSTPGARRWGARGR